VQFVDVTHAIPPQDVAKGAKILEEIAAVFPVGTIHVAVVDPGVGTARALLAVEAAGQRFLTPDNGLLAHVVRRFPPTRAHILAADRYWRKPVSATFHGRDILAPVAAHWSLGTDLAKFGPAVDVATLMTLPPDAPWRVGAALVGRIQSIDAFGNLISNIREADLPAGDFSTVSIGLGARQVIGINRCYSDRPVGSLLALINSSGFLEIAINGGSAAKALDVAPGIELYIKAAGPDLEGRRGTADDAERRG
jgi:hypothetical protein